MQSSGIKFLNSTLHKIPRSLLTQFKIKHLLPEQTQDSSRHVIHTTLITFYNLISKIDTTVTKRDFTLNQLVSISTLAQWLRQMA